MLPEPVKVVLDFVQQVNQNNAEGVAALLAPDHTFVDLAGDSEQGYERIAAGWRDYLTQFPQYQLYIRRIVRLPIGVALIGQTTGSHLQIPDEQEFNDEGVIWLARVENGLLKTWQLYADSVENATALNLEGGQEIYSPVWFARTIAKHLTCFRLAPEQMMSEMCGNITPASTAKPHLRPYWRSLNASFSMKAIVLSL